MISSHLSKGARYNSQQKTAKLEVSNAKITNKNNYKSY